MAKDKWVNGIIVQVNDEEEIFTISLDDGRIVKRAYAFDLFSESDSTGNLWVAEEFVIGTKVTFFDHGKDYEEV